MEHQRTPKPKIPKWNMSIFQNKSNHTMDTDYFLVFMSFYYRDDNWNDDESDSDFVNMHKHEEYLHSEIIH